MKSDIENFQLIQTSMYEIAKAAHTVKDTYNLYENNGSVTAKIYPNGSEGGQLGDMIHAGFGFPPGWRLNGDGRAMATPALH